MPLIGPKGKCYYCNMIFSKSGMKRHLECCKKRPEIDNKKSEKYFHLLINGYGFFSLYWLHIGISKKGTLEMMDRFFRDIWLECCGHLSVFSIGDICYYSIPRDGKSMDITLDRALTEEIFLYRYDSKEVSKLEIKVLGQYDGSGDIDLMARNEPPLLKCDRCEKEPDFICRDTMYAQRGLLCSNCMAIEGCYEEISLPVVNSPRMGICGYYGI